MCQGASNLFMLIIINLFFSELLFTKFYLKQANELNNCRNMPFITAFHYLIIIKVELFLFHNFPINFNMSYK